MIPNGYHYCAKPLIPIRLECNRSPIPPTPGVCGAAARSSAPCHPSHARLLLRPCYQPPRWVCLARRVIIPLVLSACLFLIVLVAGVPTIQGNLFSFSLVSESRLIGRPLSLNPSSLAGRSGHLPSFLRALPATRFATFCFVQERGDDAGGHQGLLKQRAASFSFARWFLRS